VGRLTLVFGLFGLVCTAVIVVAQADSVSPLLVLPVVALAAALVPSRPMRVAAAGAMCGWCCLAAASVGMFLAPCAAGMIAAARRPV
jgi:hypothetical protein